MTPLVISCPQCGCAGSFDHSEKFGDGNKKASFICSNDACKNDFSALIILNRNQPKDLLKFSGQQCDEDGRFKTDC